MNSGEGQVLQICPYTGLRFRAPKSIFIAGTGRRGPPGDAMHPPPCHSWHLLFDLGGHGELVPSLCTRQRFGEWEGGGWYEQPPPSTRTDGGI